MEIQTLLEKVQINLSPDLSPGSSKLLGKDLVQHAYEFAQRAHGDQQRISGDAYITHLLGVAEILADLTKDPIIISAGLLHDVLEDTLITYEELQEEFGEEIASLVEGVTKISKRKFEDVNTRQAESIRKMMVAMAKDVRVILIKLADRTHNMRTLSFLPLEKQERIARETLDIYAPLAHRLGISKIKSELEDLCMRYLQPEIYYDLVQKVAMKKVEREEILSKIRLTLESQIRNIGIKAQVQSRYKHFASIYGKMIKQNKSFDEIFDLMGMRVLTDNVQECYEILGLVHTLWKPLPGRFKDYIAMPKNNFYQSLHTTVLTSGSQPLEIQIRTLEMHKIAEEGIAAHWAYKEGKTVGKESQHFSWMRQLLDLQQDISELTDNATPVKVDWFEDEVFVFTPKGDVKELPVGATALDFAFFVHTDLGVHCMGVKVNGHMVPLKYPLKNGDIIEILTQSSRVPSRDWLKIVKTNRAKNKIRHWFHTHLSDEELQLGLSLLEKEYRRAGIAFDLTVKSPELQSISNVFGCSNAMELLSNIGHGDLSPKSVFHKLNLNNSTLKSSHDVSRETSNSKSSSGISSPQEILETSGIVIDDKEDLMVRFARCCTPVPGDSIIGYVTRGRGISVHRANCPNTLKLQEEAGRIVQASWKSQVNHLFEVAIEVKAHDREKLLSDMLLAISEEEVVIIETTAKALDNKMAQGYFLIGISGPDQLKKVLQKIRSVSGVISANRIEHI
jgi:GTP pyrophosphokinase